DREQVLVRHEGQRPQSRAETPGQDDALHSTLLVDRSGPRRPAPPIQVRTYWAVPAGARSCGALKFFGRLPKLCKGPPTGGTVMSVEDIGSGINRPVGGSSIERPMVAKGRAGAARVGVARGDRVEISEEARALARSRLAEAVEEAALTPERIAEIQRRIDTGFYDSPEIVHHVARAILARGDL